MRRSLALVATVLALFLTLRLAFITADPPRVLPSGFDSYELFAEPVAKAHEARNRALFDAWHTNPADNYQYWRVQSPAWVYPLWLWFEAFGVSYTSLRAFSTTVAGLGFLAAMAFALRRKDPLCMGVAGVFISINFYDLLYQRSGLIEVAVGAWLALLTYSLHRARENALWILVSSSALGLGFLSKQTMVVAIPMFLVFGLWAYVPWARAGTRPLWQRGLPLSFGLLLVVGLALYCTRPDYMRTVARNFSHVVHDELRASFDAAPPVSVRAVFSRVVDAGRWRAGFFEPMPVVSVLAVLQAARGLGRVVTGAVGRLRRRPVVAPLDDGWTALCVAWLLTSLTSFATTQTELRFRMLAFVPASLLAGALVADAARWAAGRVAGERATMRLGVAGAIALLAVSAAASFDARAYVAWVGNRTYEVASINRQIGEALGGRRAVVVGSWAPGLTFDTGAEFYYVRSEFNATPDRLRALGITHVLLMSRRDFSGAYLKAAFPLFVKRKLRSEAAFRYRERTVTLYAVKQPPLR